VIVDLKDTAINPVISNGETSPGGFLFVLAVLGFELGFFACCVGYHLIHASSPFFAPVNLEKGVSLFAQASLDCRPLPTVTGMTGALHHVLPFFFFFFSLLK
jgi:hypothetical protein